MYRDLLLRGASVGVLALLFTPSAQAQENLPTIEIGSGRPKPASSQTAQPLASKGSLTVPAVETQKRTVLSNVGSVAFVDTNTPELQTRYVHDLRDALKDTPGVFVESRYGQELRLSIRGSNLTRDYHLRGIELQQDGIPLNYADGGGDFYEVDPKFYRSIEVLKGGNALAAGSSTLGGAINFISPTAHTALAPNIVSVDGGGFGSVRGQAQASRVIGNFDFLINGTISHADGYRRHSESDYTQINGNFGYQFSKDIETRFYFGVYQTWQRLPGQLTAFETISDPRRSDPPFPVGYGANGFQANQGRDVANQRFSNKTTINTDYGRFDLDSWFIHNHLYHPIFVVLVQDGDTWGTAPKFTTKFDVAGHENNLILGARIFGGTTSDRWYDNFNGTILNPYGAIAPSFATAQYSFPPYSFNGLARYGIAGTCFGFCGTFVNPGADPRIRHNVGSSLNLETYFEDRFKIAPQWTLMFGAKFFSDIRRYSSLGDIAYDPVAATSEKAYRGVNPKVGLMFEPTKDIQIFADFTGSRDVPDFIDLTQGYFPPFQTGSTTFTSLNAQKAWTGEIGTRGKWDRFAWDVTYYHSELQDELLKFNAAPATGPATTFNAKHTMHQGIELSASAEVLRDILGPNVGDSIKLTQMWTWNDFRFVNDANYGYNPIAGIPRHVLRTTLGYAHPNGFYFAPQVDWTPQGVFADYQHTLQAPGYALIGLQAGMKLPQGVSIYIEGRNLGNVHYVSDVSTIQDARGQIPAVFYPGAGRAVYGGMRWAF